MPLSGIHVTCGYAGDDAERWSTFAIMGEVVWSETMASAGTTTHTAPPVNGVTGSPLFRVACSADVFVAIAPTPNATTGPRIFIKGGENNDFYAKAGDRLAWVLA